MMQLKRISLVDTIEYKNCHRSLCEAIASFQTHPIRYSKNTENKNESLQSGFGLGPILQTAMIEPTTATVKENNCRYG